MTKNLASPAPFQVVLVNPQIPPNTGNAGRTCSVTGCSLHLVGPFGFSLEESALRRAALDYWDDLRPEIYSGWPDFEERTLKGRSHKLHLFAARAERSLFEVRFQPGDFLVFGQEQLGLPPALLALYSERGVSIPMRPGKRSLNLAVAVGIGLYQAICCLSK